MGNILSNKTDIPALSAAATASAISIFIAPGAYNLYSLITSLTLLCLVGGYTAATKRGCLESVAFSCILAFVTLPSIGFAREWMMGSVGAKESSVTDQFVLCAWLVVIGVALVVDRFILQRRSVKLAGSLNAD